MKSYIAAALLATATVIHAQESGPISFCKDSLCNDCPNSIVTSGTGYPACVSYNTNDVFEGAGYEANDEGGVSPFISFPDAEYQCATILRTPVPANDPGCGRSQFAAQHAACVVQSLKTTFAMQFCCGTDDCAAAGVAAKKIRELGIFQDSKTVHRRNAMFGRNSISENAFFHNSNGTIIKPVSIWNVDSITKSAPKKEVAAQSVPRSMALKKRECTGFTLTSDPKGFTRPADNTQIVSPSVDGGEGGSSVTITEERTQEWSTTFEAGINFEVFSSSVSFETSESISKSTAIMVPVPAGQVGAMGFTATLRCATGTMTCDDGSTPSGDACSPQTGSNDDVLGVYGVVGQS